MPGEFPNVQRRCEPRRVGLVRISIFIALLIVCEREGIAGQIRSTSQTTNLPTAERIVNRYLKTVGGKKRLAAIRDATHDWIIRLTDQPIGKYRTQIKAPSAFRSEMTFGNGQIITATSAISAWEMGLDGQLRTLTGAESLAAKLQGILTASQLLDYKKLAVMARTASLNNDVLDSVYKVEFSTRNGARLHYEFSAKTNLLVRITDEVRKTVTRLEDYRLEQGVLQAHRLSLNSAGSGDLVFVLQNVSYNAGILESAFHPPPAEEVLDVRALLLEVGRNQDELEKRVSEYSFKKKETDRQIDDKGMVKKETVKVYEVFPVLKRESIEKLLSENGVPLNTERAAREEKRVHEEFLKAEREREKEEKKEASNDRKQKDGNPADDDDDPEISKFLKACEFVSPRCEEFGNRKAIVFDFRPRRGFRPSNREEALIAKLVGVVWIDPLDKQVMRLEARLADGFKMAGGLLLSLRPGAAFVIEQTRVAEGVWLPKHAQINLSVKVLLFGGGDYNKTIEWSDYRHFQGDVGGYTLESPKPDDTKKPE